MAAQDYTPHGYMSIGAYRSLSSTDKSLTPRDVRRLIDSGRLEGIRAGATYLVRDHRVELQSQEGPGAVPDMEMLPRNWSVDWERWAARHHRNVRVGAESRSLRFDLSVDDLVSLVRRAGGKCELTGIPFSVSEFEGGMRRPWMPSVDRIDSAAGYTVENCRIVCAATNIAMAEWGEGVLIRIAKGLLDSGRIRVDENA